MTNKQRVFLITFCGAAMFGFIDNFLLVLFGEAIDQTISATFGFSTMFSAGLGNTFSDAIGAMGEVIIAGFVLKVLGEANAEGVSRKFILLASTLGIIVGCLVGLFPLAFM